MRAWDLLGWIALGAAGVVVLMVGVLVVAWIFADRDWPVFDEEAEER